MNRALTFAGRLLLTLAAVYCVMGALISAFSLNVDINGILVAWLVTVAIFTASTTFFGGKAFTMLTIPVLALVVWKLAEIVEGAKWVVFVITEQYNAYLRIPALFSGAGASSYELTLFFAVAGIVLAYLISGSICMRRSTTLAFLFTAPFVALTFIINQTTPDRRYLIGLLAVYLTLIISGSMHPDKSVNWGKGVFPALALSMVILCGAYLIAPIYSNNRSNFIINLDTYLRSTTTRFSNTFEKPGVGWPDAISGRWRFNKDKVPVSSSGSRAIADESLLEINSTHAGVFYLRGYSMQGFDGGVWHTEADTLQISQENAANLMPARIAEIYSLRHPANAPQEAKMSIVRTGDTSDVIYRPYYSGSAEPTQSGSYFVDFYYANDSILSYYASLLGSGYLSATGLSAYNGQMRAPSIYTQVEGSTAEGLRRLALDAGIDPNADRSEIADKVAEYISSAARYSLDPFIIPDGEDFALYFLQTSRTGYCIHFATAAALMLRALDIPARLTSGFLVVVPDGQEGKTVVVTDRNAHAWVEVYYENIGWIPLEATPATPRSGVQGVTPHTAAPVPAPTDAPEEGDEYDNDAEETPAESPPDEPPDEPPGDENSGDEYGNNDAGDLGSDEGNLPSQIPGQSPGSDAQAEANAHKVMRTDLVVIACIAVCIAILAIRRSILRNYRRKRFSDPDANESVIYAWKYVSRLSKRGDPPEEIEKIALKARFSPHRITEEERAEVIKAVGEYAAELYEKQNLPGRLRLKCIIGI